MTGSPNWKNEYDQEQRSASRRGALVATLVAVFAAAFLAGIFVNPAITVAAAGALAFVGGAAALAFHYMREKPAQIVVRAGHAKLCVRLQNSPFSKESTSALLDGAVDYLLRGLRTGVLPELEGYKGPSTYLASPASSTPIPAPAVNDRPEARSKQPEATPVRAETPQTLLPETARVIMDACPEAVAPLKELAARQATAVESVAHAPKPVVPAAKPATVVADGYEDPDREEPDYSEDPDTLAAEDAESQELAARAAPTDCEICRAEVACGTTEVFDGRGMLAVKACADCITKNDQFQEEHGYPQLYKRGDGGLVWHNAAPAPVAIK